MPKETGPHERESKLASGWTVESDTAAHTEAAIPAVADVPQDLSDRDQDEISRPQMSNGALVVLGVLGGLYLLYTWVWFSWANYYAETNTLVAEGSGSIGFVLQQVSYWAAPAAPALWFFCALVLNRHAATWRLALWLIVGGIVLVPLPMFGSVGGA